MMHLMAERDVDDDQAYEMLRLESMIRQPIPELRINPAVR